MKHTTLALSILAALTLSACGGGSSHHDPVADQPTPKPPVVDQGGNSQNQDQNQDQDQEQKPDQYLGEAVYGGGSSQPSMSATDKLQAIEEKIANKTTEKSDIGDQITALQTAISGMSPGSDEEKAAQKQLADLQQKQKNLDKEIKNLSNIDLPKAQAAVAKEEAAALEKEAKVIEDEAKTLGDSEPQSAVEAKEAEAEVKKAEAEVKKADAAQKEAAADQYEKNQKVDDLIPQVTEAKEKANKAEEAAKNAEEAAKAPNATTEQKQEAKEKRAAADQAKAEYDEKEKELTAAKDEQEAAEKAVTEATAAKNAAETAKTEAEQKAEKAKEAAQYRGVAGNSGFSAESFKKISKASYANDKWTITFEGEQPLDIDLASGTEIGGGGAYGKFIENADGTKTALKDGTPGTSAYGFVGEKFFSVGKVTAVEQIEKLAESSPTANYSGSAFLKSDGKDLVAKFAADANFKAKTFDGTFSGFNTYSDPSTPQKYDKLGEKIEFAAEIDGNRFTPKAGETTKAYGQFYGENASDVGGVVESDKITGAFGGKQQ